MVREVWKIWIEMAPWLLLGAFAASLIHVFLPKGFVNRHLSGRLGVLKAVLIGIPLPLCSCAVIPAGLGLKKSGASNGATVGFLISTPQTGVDSVMVSGSMLGWPFALLKVAVALVTGLAGGLSVGTSTRPKAVLNVVEIPAQPTDVPVRNRWTEFAQHFLMLIQSLWGWLVIGVLISAAISVWVPEDSIGSLPGFRGWPSLFLVLLLAIPLYVCATASVPIAAALVASGLSPGAALVFLMAGPATNIATIGAVYRTLGRRALMIYLSSIIIGSVGAGLLFNQVLSSSFSGTHIHAMAPSWWEVAASVFLAVLVTWFALCDGVEVVKRWRPSEELSGQRFDVQGMTCNGCASKLKRVLLNHSKIDDASVSFAEGRAIVSGAATADQICHLVRQAGFEASLQSAP